MRSFSSCEMGNIIMWCRQTAVTLSGMSAIRLVAVYKPPERSRPSLPFLMLAGMWDRM